METMTNYNLQIEEILLPDGSCLKDYLMHRAQNQVTLEYIQSQLHSENGALIKEIKRRLRPADNIALINEFIASATDSADRAVLLW